MTLKTANATVTPTIMPVGVPFTTKTTAFYYISQALEKERQKIVQVIKPDVSLTSMATTAVISLATAQVGRRQ